MQPVGDMKVRELLWMLRSDGWKVVRQRGSHRQFRHPYKPGLVTVAGHPGDEVARGTLASVLRQAGFGP
jgi:predicted RNA binding protein YcfA (HicA-like mRNA interferase family)